MMINRGSSEQWAHAHMHATPQFTLEISIVDWMKSEKWKTKYNTIRMNNVIAHTNYAKKKN